MRTCRYCGSSRGTRLEGGIAVCDACANSPLCDRCGHPRSDHGQVYVRGVPAGCRRVIGDFQSLMSWTCDCSGFRPVTTRLSEAGFAAPDAVDPLALGLRTAASD